MNESDALETFILKVSRFDVNAGAWLVEQLQETFGEKDQTRNTLLRLYSSIILGTYPEDVKSSAIFSLASSLETVLDFSHDNFHGIELPWDALDRQINPSSDAPIWNRDRSNAELHLQGCLLAAKVIANQCESLQEDVARWTVKLQFAMQEETVSFNHPRTIVCDLSANEAKGIYDSPCRGCLRHRIWARASFPRQSPRRRELLPGAVLDPL